MPDQAIEARVALYHPADSGLLALQSGAWPQLTLASARVTERVAAWARQPVFPLHDGGLQVGRRGPDLLLRFEASSDALPAGLTWATATVPDLPNARSWQRPGWFGGVTTWLCQQLDVQGAHLTGELSSVGSYDLACVLRGDSSLGPLYFKAGSGREARVTAQLAGAQPDLLPPLLAADLARGWLLTLDGGRRLDRVADLNSWRAAPQRLAHFQQTADAGTLTRLGCPTHPFAELAERGEVVLRDRLALLAWGLSAEQVDALADLVPAVRAAVSTVSALGLPDLPAHGDAHPMNALCGDAGPIWFDWSEACIQHPFMDAGRFLAWTQRRRDLALHTAHPDAAGHLRAAYLDALELSGADMELRLAVPLAVLQHALTFDTVYRHWSGTLPGWRPEFAPYLLRTFLHLASALRA